MQHLTLCWDGDPIGTVELTEAPSWMTLTPAERAAGVPPSSEDPLRLQGRFKGEGFFEYYLTDFEDSHIWSEESFRYINHHGWNMWCYQYGDPQKHLLLKPNYPVLRLEFIGNDDVEIQLEARALPVDR